MCGITGWLSSGGPIEPDVLASMTDALKHRGPDATGTYIDRWVGSRPSPLVYY
jgi:asparagine synthetase B (glutamine-hydrolysing)